jgi:hypothetical protein
MTLFWASNFAGQYLWSGGHFNICWSYWGIQKIGDNLWKELLFFAYGLNHTLLCVPSTHQQIQLAITNVKKQQIVKKVEGVNPLWAVRLTLHQPCEGVSPLWTVRLTFSQRCEGVNPLWIVRLAFCQPCEGVNPLCTEWSHKWLLVGVSPLCTKARFKNKRGDYPCRF